MPTLTASAAERVEADARQTPVREIAAYLQRQLGQRLAAHLAGLSDTRQIGRFAKPDGPRPRPLTERRLREGYHVVRMIIEAHDADTAKAWLFGTNTRLDDAAPIEVLGDAAATEEFAAVVRAARQFASFA